VIQQLKEDNYKNSIEDLNLAIKINNKNKGQQEDTIKNLTSMLNETKSLDQNKEKDY